MENLDDRAQRIQDRLRADGDEEAAELIDELYGLALPDGEGSAPAKKRWQDDPLQQIRVMQPDGSFKSVRKTKAIAAKMTAALARAKGHSGQV